MTLSACPYTASRRISSEMPRRLKQMLETVVPYLADALMVAHNAPFDAAQLRFAAQRCGIRLPPFETQCTRAHGEESVSGPQDVQLGFAARFDRPGFHPSRCALGCTGMCAFISQMPECTGNRSRVAHVCKRLLFCIPQDKQTKKIQIFPRGFGSRDRF